MRKLPKGRNRGDSGSLHRSATERKKSGREYAQAVKDQTLSDVAAFGPTEAAVKNGVCRQTVMVWSKEAGVSKTIAPLPPGPICNILKQGKPACRRPAQTGFKRCALHRAIQARGCAAFISRRRAAGVCQRCNSPSAGSRSLCLSHARERAAIDASRNVEERRIILAHYGTLCACCKESNEEFLTIDHIGGGGTKHRERIKSRAFYPWLIANGFPAGFRTLCWNCNMATRFGAACPHQTDSMPDVIDGQALLWKGAN